MFGGRLPLLAILKVLSWSSVLSVSPALEAFIKPFVLASPVWPAHSIGCGICALRHLAAGSPRLASASFHMRFRICAFRSDSSLGPRFERNKRRKPLQSIIQPRQVGGCNEKSVPINLHGPKVQRWVQDFWLSCPVSRRIPTCNRHGASRMLNNWDADLLVLPACQHTLLL